MHRGGPARRRSPRTFVLGALLAVVLAGCGSSGGGSDGGRSAVEEKLASAIEDRGLHCADPTPDPPPAAGPTRTLCRLDAPEDPADGTGGFISVLTYPSEAARRKVPDAGRPTACPPGTSVVVLEAGPAVLTASDPALLYALADQVEGRTRRLPCPPRASTGAPTTTTAPAGPRPGTSAADPLPIGASAQLGSTRVRVTSVVLDGLGPARQILGRPDAVPARGRFVVVTFDVTSLAARPTAPKVAVAVVGGDGTAYGEACGPPERTVSLATRATQTLVTCLDAPPATADGGVVRVRVDGADAFWRNR